MLLTELSLETWRKLCKFLFFLQFQVQWLIVFIDGCFLHFLFLSWNMIEEVCTLDVHAITTLSQLLPAPSFDYS